MFGGTALAIPKSFGVGGCGGGRAQDASTQGTLPPLAQTLLRAARLRAPKGDHRHGS